MATSGHNTFQPATSHKQQHFPRAANRTRHASSPAFHPVIPLQFQRNPQHVLAAQSLIGNRAVVQLLNQTHNRETQSVNKTGLPTPLKTGIESLSGIDLSDVRVHYYSEKPSQLQALAYAQGEHIYLGAGQERHLPHEAWHVVQQKQGRVKPTLQMKTGIGINDDATLEQEATQWGEKAEHYTPNEDLSLLRRKTVDDPQVVQRKVENLTLESGDNLNTIVGALKQGTIIVNGTPWYLNEIYQANVDGLKKKEGLINLYRAKFAKATIVPEIDGKRGNNTSEYGHVKALGEWEHLASTHTKERNLDTGHLIADVFFAPEQKQESYVATNLAPQDTHINVSDYKRKENDIKKIVKDDISVEMHVKLNYGDSPKYSLKTLVERGALKNVYKPKKDKTDPNFLKELEDQEKKTSIEVPRRIPSQWTLDIQKLKGEKEGDTIKYKNEGDPEHNSGFTKELAFYDPKGLLNPTEVFKHKDNSYRYTEAQLEEGEKTIKSIKYAEKAKKYEEVLKTIETEYGNIEKPKGLNENDYWSLFQQALINTLKKNKEAFQNELNLLIKIERTAESFKTMRLKREPQDLLEGVAKKSNNE
ncbi:DUF4157 domain-containing protein [Candidatus Fukatsuia symbiotica]|uniref:DUF4157 domain-containing protein n=1 Tax=Candidatus Fukatsuia symbiotica TaxID=1878942 RepID=A0A2U8I7F5_9GAMM|nr:DUF4157 domain-containing protein [Candidatus Fukatsuia symbiotica]AWK15102.1 hypothetical protein CCS41_12485 [Candidatus Fukatsuia symbiotica]MEA9443915.1 DUF4157 domain-containing protein [Candidatus Fukatsuia symbiotica]